MNWGGGWKGRFTSMGRHVGADPLKDKLSLLIERPWAEFLG
jgi:hypothetical protein